MHIGADDVEPLELLAAQLAALLSPTSTGISGDEIRGAPLGVVPRAG